MLASWGSETAPISAWVEVTRDEAGYRADIRTDQSGSQGQRELRAASCQELVEATEVVLSLLLQQEPTDSEPVAPAEEPLEPPAPEVVSVEPLEPTAGTAAESEQADDEAERRTASRRLAFERTAHVAVGVTAFGETPVELGALAGAALGRDGLGFGVDLGYRRPLGGVDRAEVVLEYQSVELTALACADLGVRLCLGARAEAFLAAATNVAEPRMDVALVPGAVAGVTVPFALGPRARLLLGVEGHGRLQRVRLEVAPYGEVLVLPALGGSFRIGPEFEF